MWPYDAKGNLLLNYTSLVSSAHFIPNNEGKSKVSITVEDNSDDEDIQKNYNSQNQKNNSYLYIVTNKVNNDVIKSMDVVGDMQPINEATRVIFSMLPCLMGINIIIGLILAYFYSKKITKPILILSNKATNMRNGSYQDDLYRYSPDELGDLSEDIDNLYNSLNENMEKLQFEMSKVAKLEKSKTEFMRVAGHELKTPITALGGITESMINNIGKYKDRDTYLVECKNIIDDLAILISEILSVSELDIIKETNNDQYVNLSEIISNSLSKLQFLSEEKHINIAINSAELIIKTNVKRITTVINNILSNAVKYTVANGTIKITLLKHPIPQLIIENECNQLDLEDMDQFFEPFYTKDTSHSKRHEGTGLGLYIVKKNIEALEYNYSVEKTNLGFLIKILFE